MGLQKILSLLEAEDADVRIHAVKVVANLAAEGINGAFSLYLFVIFLHLLQLDVASSSKDMNENVNVHS